MKPKFRLPFPISKETRAICRAVASPSYWKAAKKRVSSRAHKEALRLFMKRVPL